MTLTAKLCNALFSDEGAYFNVGSELHKLYFDIHQHNVSKHAFEYLSAALCIYQVKYFITDMVSVLIHIFSPAI